MVDIRTYLTAMDGVAELYRQGSIDRDECENVVDMLFEIYCFDAAQRKAIDVFDGGMMRYEQSGRSSRLDSTS